MINKNKKMQWAFNLTAKSTKVQKIPERVANKTLKENESLLVYNLTATSKYRMKPDGKKESQWAYNLTATRKRIENTRKRVTNRKSMGV